MLFVLYLYCHFSAFLIPQYFGNSRGLIWKPLNMQIPSAFPPILFALEPNSVATTVPEGPAVGVSGCFHPSPAHSSFPLGGRMDGNGRGKSEGRMGVSAGKIGGRGNTHSLPEAFGQQVQPQNEGQQSIIRPSGVSFTTQGPLPTTD